ncbi:MAG: site-specific DNA-methyltransferase [Planctomycetota bacterium]|nr:site-specific DNA-methyltransferase [Planctomycetota bacterium]
MANKVEKLLKNDIISALPDYALWQWPVEQLLDKIPTRTKFDLVISSPPYNLGQQYETKKSFNKYLRWQADIIESLIPHIKKTGSICWQVGNYVENGHILPLDIYLHPIFSEMGLQLRNRIIWRFGHGLHCRRRFSGRYEVVLWYTLSDEYIFDLDSVRIPAKYPGKRNKNGKLTSNPLGKNPEDIWDIPNVVGNHKEKTSHPCQFPVGLVERLILSLSKKGGRVFDPFCGSGSAGVAAAVHNRKFLGADKCPQYISIAKNRIAAALNGNAKYRPHSQEIYDHKKSKLSLRPVK